jgi:hypothetical protein
MAQGALAATKAVIDAVIAMGENISRVLTRLVDDVGKIISRAVDFITEAMQRLLGFVSTALSRIAGAISEILGRIAGAAGTTLKVVSGLSVAIGVVGARAETEFRRAFGLIGGTLDDTTNKMREFAITLPQAIPVSLLQTGQGLYQTYSAGIRDTASAQTLLTQTAKAVVATNAELLTSIPAVARALKAFKLEGVDAVSEAIDILITIENQGIITFGEMATALGRVTASGAAAGFSLRDIGAAMATLTKQFTPEQAFTRLNRLMVQLVRDASSAESKLRDMGIEVFKLGDQERELASQIQRQIGILETRRQRIEEQNTTSKAARIEAERMTGRIAELNEQLRQTLTAGETRDLSNILIDIVRGIRASGRNVAAAIQDLIPEERASSALKAIEALFDDFVTQVEDNFADVAGATDSRFEEAAKAVSNVFKLVVNQVEVIAFRIEQAFGPIIKEVFFGLRDLFGEVGDALTETFATEQFQRWRDEAVVTVREAIDALTETLLALPGNIKKVAATAARFFEDLKPAIEAVASRISPRSGSRWGD